MEAYRGGDRRPLVSRSWKTSERIANFLARRGATQNAISIDCGRAARATAIACESLRRHGGSRAQDRVAHRKRFPHRRRRHVFHQARFINFCHGLHDALPIWRKNCGAHSLENLCERLLAGESVYILFPEGTRTRTGALAKFKPGLGRLVAGTSVPIVPVLLERNIRSVAGDTQFAATEESDGEHWRAIKLCGSNE